MAHTEEHGDSFDSIFDLSAEQAQEEETTEEAAPEVEAAPAEELEQEQKPEEEAPDTEPAEEEGEEEEQPEEPTSEDEDPVEARLAALEEEMKVKDKRIEDTRKWGNEANQKLMALVKTLKESGEVPSEEELENLVSKEMSAEDPLQPIREQFAQDLVTLKPYMAKQGKDVDMFVEAFNNLGPTEPGLVDELLSTPKDQQTMLILEKGEALAEPYALIKEHGSIAKAFEAIRAETAAEKEKPATKKTEKPSPRPKVRGTSDPKQEPEQVPSFDSIFTA